MQRSHDQVAAACPLTDVIEDQARAALVSGGLVDDVRIFARAAISNPDYPVMPGVLIIEAMAQVGGLLTELPRAASGAPARWDAFACSSARWKRSKM